MSKRSVIWGGAVLALANAAGAQVIDGTIAGDAYGPAVAVQTVETGFGDNFSELNAAYATISGGRLNLAFTGNIEANFNKFEIFIDSRAGGFGARPMNPNNDSAGVLSGLTFDTGFTADYHIIVRRGNFGGDRFDIDFANLQAGTASGYFNIFGGATEGAASTGIGANALPIGVGYNNSNTAGIGGTAGAPANQAAALAVMTGLELSIDLADLGLPLGDIKVLAFQNNQDHNYLSNQFLGGLPVGTGNLGGDGAGGFIGGVNINLNNFAGDQFFVIPTPATAGLLGLGGLVALRRRR